MVKLKIEYWLNHFTYGHFITSNMGSKRFGLEKYEKVCQDETKREAGPKKLLYSKANRC